MSGIRKLAVVLSLVVALVALAPPLSRCDDPLTNLSADELAVLFEQVFALKDEEAITFLADVPPTAAAANAFWLERLDLVKNWAGKLYGKNPSRRIRIVLFQSVGYNADLPPHGREYALTDAMPLPGAVLAGTEVDIKGVLKASPVVIGLTERSVTAPFKELAVPLGFRGASMPSFNLDMIGALRLDATEVGRRCLAIKRHLTGATLATIEFEVMPGKQTYVLRVDLRHRDKQLFASAGIIHSQGTVANLPPGETYMVPYEGEISGDSSGTSGLLPVQFGDEIVLYDVEGNRAVSVVGDGPAARAEREKLRLEPAYGNIAELGFGVLAEMGVAALPDLPDFLLLNEKRGFHLAFGKSKHFGGQVGSEQFNDKDRVEHIDRVYTPETQPRINIKVLTLTYLGGRTLRLMENSRYVPSVFNP